MFTFYCICDGAIWTASVEQFMYVIATRRQSSLTSSTGPVRHVLRGGVRSTNTSTSSADSSSMQSLGSKSASARSVASSPAEISSTENDEFSSKPARHGTAPGKVVSGIASGNVNRSKPATSAATKPNSTMNSTSGAQAEKTRFVEWQWRWTLILKLKR